MSTSLAPHAETSGRYRPAVATEGRARLRSARLRGRLGPAGGYVPARKYQFELDAGRRSAEERGDQDQVCRGRLRRLPEPRAMHAVVTTAEDGHHPAPG